MKAITSCTPQDWTCESELALPGDEEQFAQTTGGHDEGLRSQGRLDPMFKHAGYASALQGNLLPKSILRP